MSHRRAPFFGGLTSRRPRKSFVSPDTVKRDWRMAKLWLLRQLEGRSPE